MDRKMRRFRQELPLHDVMQILNEGEVCVLAVDGDDNYPYAVPINYVFDGEKIYLHSASRGHKIDALRSNPRLSLCVIEKAEVVPAEFTTYFRSIIVFGRARFVNDEQQKIDALRKLSEKYSPGIDPTNEINRFIKVVTIIEITIDSMTGKESIELTHQRP